MRRRSPGSPPSRAWRRRTTQTRSPRSGGLSRRASTRAPDFFIRTSDEGHKTFVQQFLQTIRDNGRDDIYQDTYAGLYCVGCEAFKNGGRPRRREVPRARHRAGVDRGAQLVLPALGLSGRAARAVRRAGRLRASRLQGERGAELHRRWAPGLLDLARRPTLGHPDSLGPRPGRLRLGRCARQLRQRADVRPCRRGSPVAVLAGGQAPAREGHPPLSLRLLAGHAPCRRRGGAAPALRPRLPAARRSEDLEVARKRAQPTRPRRELRRRRAAVLVRSQRLVRSGRNCVGSRAPRPLRA